MKLVNLTPHDIVIMRDCGKITIAPSGVVARASITKDIVGDIDGIPVRSSFVGGAVNLPDPVDGTMYIVSTLTAAAAKDRKDLLVVDDVIRNDNGVVIGCGGFLQPNR